jgi:presenilin-like A22 family membrane protease
VLLISVKESRTLSVVLPFLMMAGFLVLVDGLAILAVNTFNASGVRVFQNTNDPLDLVFFFVTLLVFTGLVLIISRLRKKRVLRVIFVFSIGALSFYVFDILLSVVLSDIWSQIFSLIGTLGLIISIMKYPEWYVVDACGIILGIGSTVTVGLSLSVPLVVALLIVMSIYDAISVYRTRHMISLGDAVLDLKIPVVLVIPKIKSYSLLEDNQSIKEKLEKREERQAFLLGLGDIVFPGILVVSAFYNSSSYALAVALSTMVGTLIGFIVLSFIVLKGKPQAGLPFLCSGAIIGYFLSSYLLFGKLFS